MWDELPPRRTPPSLTSTVRPGARRAATRHARPARGSRFVALLLAVALLASAGAGVSLYQVLNHPEKGRHGTTPARAEPLFAGKQQVFLLLLDSNETNRSQHSDKCHCDTFILARVDLPQQRVAALRLPGDTRVQQSGGRGYDKLSAVCMQGGPPLVRQSLEQLLKISIDRYLKADVSDFGHLPEVIEQGMESIETDMSESELSALASVLRQRALEPIAMATLPGKIRHTRKVRYFVMDEERASGVLRQLFGLALGARSDIVVLNGSGLPGIAGEAARRLKRAGLQVGHIGNASRFDYEKTEIRVSKGYEAEGRRVAAVLKLPTEALVSDSNTATDSESAQPMPPVTVVLGKDYRP